MTTSEKWDANRRRRGAACLSDLTLDRALTGELDGAEASAANAHLAACGPCAEARAALALARDRFLAEQDLPALAADALARAGSSVPTVADRGRWLRWLGWLGLAAGAAGALLLFRPARPDPAAIQGGDGDRRSKGSLTLGLYVQHPEAGSEGRLHLGEPLHPGDRLRFSVTSDRAGHLAVLGIDRTGTVSVYHPQKGAGAVAAPIGAQTPTPLATAVELDDSLGDEMVVAVRCNDALPVAEIVAAARKSSAPAASGGALGLPCAEARYRITKVSR